MDNPKQPASDSASVLLRGASPPEAGVTPWRDSTFTVRLPLARAATPARIPATDGRDRGDDTQPPRTRARRLGDPLCRCS
jgi:hypothetical protein